MTSLADVFIQGRIDTSRFGTDIKSGMNSRAVTQSSEDAGKQAGSRFSGAFKSAMKVGAVVAAGAGAAYLKGAVSAAADLQETVSKTEQIFGKSGGGALQKWAKDASTALGQTRQQALDAAGTFGIFGKAAGLEGDKLTGFSKQMTTLASDLASFNNTSPDEAINALGSALRGEAEPLRAYGVMLDDATLKAEALALGIMKPVQNQAKIESYQVKIIEGQKAYNDAVAEFGPKSLEALKAEAQLGSSRDLLKKAVEGTIPPLTQQQKVLAARSAIMKQTGDAQGDFARTSDGLANQQRILTAQWNDAQASIGKGLLPIVTRFVKFLNADAIPAVKSTAKWIKRNDEWLLPLVGTLGTGALVFATITKVTKAWAAAQVILNVALTANPIGLVIAALAALGVGLFIAWKKSETFRKVVTSAFGAVKEKVQIAALFVADKVLWMAEKMLGAMAFAFSWVPGLGDKLKKASSAIKEFREDVNREMDQIRDEEVNIGFAVGRRKSQESSNSGFGPQIAGGRGPIPRSAMGGGGNGLVFRPQTSGAMRGVAQVASSAQASAHETALALAKKEKAKRAKQGMSSGHAGPAGAVLPRGSYRIGMPYHGYPGHNGADYPAAIGTPVYAPWAGRVTASYDLPGSNPYNSTPYRSYGRVVKIAYENGMSSLFAHLSERIGRLGPIAAGTMVGRVGTNGNSSGPHLHAEFNGGSTNPASLGIFDRGGIMKGLGINLSGQPERVLSPKQTRDFERLVNAQEGRRGTGLRPIHVHFGNQEFVRMVDDRIESHVDLTSERRRAR